MVIGIDARMYRSSVAGIGRYSQNLIKNLLELDHHNQYILFMTAEDYQEFKNPKSKIQMTNKISNVKIQITNIPHYSLAEQTKLAKIIEREKPNLMHFLHFNVPANFSGKYLVTIHDLTLLFYPEAARDINLFKRWGFRYVLKKTITRAAKIIAVSQNTKQDIVRIYKVNPDKIKVIYEAADDKVFEKISQKTLTKPVILYVGQMRKHKNVERLIAAVQILKREIPCQLVILGGSLGKKIVKDAIMPGFVSDQELASWYKSAAVLVMPSLYEGFGLPGLEAMQAGTPVVSSNRASLPEIYGDAALYFDPSNINDIADKIKMVLTNNKLRRDLIRKGQKRAQKYSWRKTAESTLEVYKEVNSKFKMQNSNSKF